MKTDLPHGDYPDWETLLSDLCLSTGRTLILGGTDTGKTTFVRELVNRITGSNRTVSVLDCDIGQSEIGSPGCIGLGFTDTSVRALSEMSSVKLGFVGSISPSGHLAPYFRAITHLLPESKEVICIVDMGGYIRGREARELSQTLFELIKPDHVVAMQRTSELEAILGPIRRRENCQVITPNIPSIITKKSMQFRRQRRSLKFAAYFQNSQVSTYNFEDVSFVGSWLGYGTPLAAHLLKFINLSIGLGIKVYYAETVDHQLFMMANRHVSQERPEMGLIMQHLKMKSLTVTRAPDLNHVLLGLEASNGQLLGMGILQAIDFRRRTFGVLTPIRTPSSARVVHFGTLRIQSDGTEIGSLSGYDLG